MSRLPRKKKKALNNKIEQLLSSIINSMDIQGGCIYTINIVGIDLLIERKKGKIFVSSK